MRTHVFRQSFLTTHFEVCEEQSRLVLVDELPRVETDAACIGTAVHYAIEMDLDHYQLTKEHLSFDEMFAIGSDKFLELSQLPNFEWKKWKGVKAANNRISRCIQAYILHVLPKMNPVLLEHKFGPYLFHEDNEREIYLEGTMDLVDLVLGVCDFKTSSDVYDVRKYQKSAIQPTVYTWARAFELGRTDEPFPFTYFVLIRDNDKKCEVDVQEFTVWRGPAHWNWLKTRLIDLAVKIEADLPAWSKNDDTPLCSDKWCPAYKSCAGNDLNPV